MVVQPGDCSAQVARPERLAAVAHQHDDGADIQIRNEDGGVRPDGAARLGMRRLGLNGQVRDLGCGTLPDEIFEPRPRRDDRSQARRLAISLHIPGPIGANQPAQIFEIATRCSRESAPPQSSNLVDLLNGLSREGPSALAQQTMLRAPLFSRRWRNDCSVDR